MSYNCSGDLWIPRQAQRFLASAPSRDVSGGAWARVFHWDREYSYYTRELMVLITVNWYLNSN